MNLILEPWIYGWAVQTIKWVDSAIEKKLTFVGEANIKKVIEII